MSHLWRASVSLDSIAQPVGFPEWSNIFTLDIFPCTWPDKLEGWFLMYKWGLMQFSNTEPSWTCVKTLLNWWTNFVCGTKFATFTKIKVHKKGNKYVAEVEVVDDHCKLVVHIGKTMHHGLIPRSRPAFRHLQYRKTGEGLVFLPAMTCAWAGAGLSFSLPVTSPFSTHTRKSRSGILNAGLTSTQNERRDPRNFASSQFHSFTRYE